MLQVIGHRLSESRRQPPSRSCCGQGHQRLGRGDLGSLGVGLAGAEGGPGCRQQREVAPPVLSLLLLTQGELGTLRPVRPGTLLLPGNEDVLLTSHQSQFHVERTLSRRTVRTLCLLPCPGPPDGAGAWLCSQPVPGSVSLVRPVRSPRHRLSQQQRRGSVSGVRRGGCSTGALPFVARGVRCRRHGQQPPSPCALCAGSPWIPRRARCSSSSTSPASQGQLCAVSAGPAPLLHLGARLRG